MKTIAMSNEFANQEFFVVVEGVSYGFRLHTFRDMLYCDITVGAELKQRSVRCIDRKWLISERFMNGGNFRFEHEVRGSYPNWRELGTRCRLVYYDYAEIAAMEEG